MTTSATLVSFSFATVGLAACGAVPTPDPPAVVALARTSQDVAASQLAAGLALEVGHLLATRPDVVVREVTGSSVTPDASFSEVTERLGADLVIRVEVAGSAARPVVSYTMETSRGEQRAERDLLGRSDDLFSVPRRIGEEALLLLKRRGRRGSQFPAWPIPAPPSAYAEFLRALGEASSPGPSEADRVALYDALPRALDSYPPAVTELGAAYLELAGRSSGTAPYYDRAEQIFLRALQLDTLYPPARQKLASYFAKRGQSEKSLTLLQNGLATHPVYPGYHDQLGYVLRYAGLMEASMQRYQRAQELDPSLENLVASQDQITKSLIYLGQYREALLSHQRMESFLARLGRASDEKEWFYRGVIHLYAGQRDQALDAFRRGQALDSASVWTTFGRAYAGIAHGDRHEVAKVLDELEHHVVVDGERHYRLVHFASFLQQHERALKHLETSIRGGFFNAPYIAGDPLTADLRSNPGFVRVLSEAQQRHSAFKALVEQASN